MAETDTPIHPWFMKRRYLFPVIVLSFVILSATAFYISYRHYTMNTELSLKEDRSTANLLSLIMDERLKSTVSVMESYSNMPLLLQAVKNKNVEKAREHLINLVKNNPDIGFVVISDRWGTPWAASYAHSPVLGKNFAHRDWYKGVSKEWKSYLSDVVLRVVEEKDLAFQISVPCINEKGEVIGILVNTQRAVTLGNLIKRVPLDPGNFITLTDRKGQIIYSSEHDDKTEIKLYPFYAGMKKAMAAKNITFAAFDPDRGGGSRYISFAPVANFGWTVFVERNKRSIFLSETGYYIRVTAITCLLCLIIIQLLVYSRNQVKAQQIMAQLQAEKKIEAGEVKFRTLTENIQVGIVAHAPDTSIILSNPMASEILGLTPDQMRGMKAIDPAWCFIQEDGTKVPLAEYPINRALAEEMPISGLVLGVIRPDRQSPTWVECNARKIWGPAGELEQAIVVFSDITERKKLEAALAKNYQWLTFINEYASALPLQPPERLRTYAADRLKELTNATAVMITEYDTKTSELVVVGSTLAPDPDSAIRRLLGRNIVGLRSPVSPEMYREIVKSPVGAMQSMHEVTFSAVPKLVGGAIEKFLGITGFIGLALTNDQQLMGTLMIVANNATRQPNPDVLSSFASITAITIERQRTEEKLLQHRAHLEAMVAERTAELSAKTTELERINKIFVDRELRMRELKARIAELEGKT